jgi:DNA-binding NtrC family response regulator
MRKRRAIIFDDSESVLSFFRDYFTFLNYEVLAFHEPKICPIYAANPRSCTSQGPCADIVLTDFHMPRMNGADLLRAQLRLGCKLPPGNKALLSSDIDQNEVRSITSLGFAFFRKPVMLDRMMAWISSCEERMDLAQPLGDRRREERTPASSAQEWYQMDTDTGGVACIVMNESESGLCLKTPAPLRSEQLVYVTTASGELRAASVRWSRKYHDGSYLSGLTC